MNADELLVVVLLLIYLSTLMYLALISRKRSTWILIINLGILLLYSIYFGIQFHYGEPSSGLAWWFYYLVFLTIHWICNGTLLILRLVRQHTK